MKKITFLLSLLFCAVGHAQVSGYILSQTADTYVSLAENVSTANGDDGSQNNLPIGFDFVLGGASYNTFSINTNGWIRLGSTIAGQSWVNTLGNNAVHAPLIAPYWDDHNRGNGIISYQWSGDAPNRILTVEWNNISISTNGGANPAAIGSFKLLLHETTNVIEFIYGSLVPGAQQSASVGINDVGSFLSITPDLSSSATGITANNTVANMPVLTGQRLTLTPPAPCQGNPNPGATLSTATAACDNVQFTLSLENELGDTGLSYQWQYSANGIDFADVANQTSDTYTTTQDTTTFYRCLVSCGAASAASTPIEVVQNAPAQCYCIPNYTNGVTDGDLISNVSISGTTLSNFTGALPSGPSYNYYTGQPNYTAVLQAGVSYDIAVTVGTFGQQEIAVWVDYNDDAIFGADEKVGFTQTQIGGGGTGIFPIQIGCNISPGVHRMRIRDVWNNNAENMDPCSNYGYGETEDYDITVLAASGCQRPEELMAENVSSSSAVLSWAFGCGHVSWDVYVTGHGGEFPSDNPTHPNVQIGMVVSSLDPDTGYEFYVRAHCDGDQVSDWAGPFDFTTMPLGVSNDDCQTATVLVPGSSFEQNAVVATNLAATTTVGQPAPTCGVFGFGGDVWFSTVVPADGNITIEVQADPGSSVEDTAMTVLTGDCSSLTALGCSDDEGIDAFSMMILTGLTPGQTIYARVWEYANDRVGTFRVSAWSASLKSAGFDATRFKYHPNPVKDFLNLSYNEAISKVEIYNLVGQLIMTKTMASEQASVDLSTLPRATYLAKVKTVTGQSKVIKIIKE